jgi:hypothetical protein
MAFREVKDDTGLIQGLDGFLAQVGVEHIWDESLIRGASSYCEGCASSNRNVKIWLPGSAG